MPAAWRLACRTHAPAIYILPTPSSQERVLYGFARLTFMHVGDEAAATLLYTSLQQRQLFPRRGHTQVWRLEAQVMAGLRNLPQEMH